MKHKWIDTELSYASIDHPQSFGLRVVNADGIEQTEVFETNVAEGWLRRWVTNKDGTMFRERLTGNIKEETIHGKFIIQIKIEVEVQVVSHFDEEAG